MNQSVQHCKMDRERPEGLDRITGGFAFGPLEVKPARRIAWSHRRLRYANKSSGPMRRIFRQPLSPYRGSVEAIRSGVPMPCPFANRQSDSVENPFAIEQVTGPFIVKSFRRTALIKILKSPKYLLPRRVSIHNSWL